jgi:hypothetical protein
MSGGPIDRDRLGRPIKRQCTAHVKRDGGRRCLRSAVRGSSVCPSHGAAARQVRAAAARRVASAAAVEACQVFGLPVDTTPEAALQDELNRTYGAVVWLRAEVAALGLAAYGSPWLELLNHERDYLVTVAKVMMAGDVRGRLADTAAEAAAWLTGRLDAILDGLALTPDQRARVPEVVMPLLRLADPGPDGDGAA